MSQASGKFSKSIRAVIELVLLILIAMVAYSWIGTEHYKPGDTASGHIPIVLNIVGSSPPRYKLVKLSSFADTMVADPSSLSPKLPELNGSFTLPPEHGTTPQYINFQVKILDNGQRVLVKHRDEDYSTEGQYITNGSTLQPERYFSGHGMSMVFAAFIGLFGAKLLSWLQSFLWRRMRPGCSMST